MVGALGLGASFLTHSFPFRKERINLECPGNSEEEAADLVFDQPRWEAAKLKRQGKWAEAKAKLVEVQGMKPSQSLMDSLTREIAWIETEISNQQRLEAAQAALSAGKLAKARAELNAVSSNTWQSEQLSKQREELKTAAVIRFNEAEALLKKGQPNQALLIAEDVLAAFPDHCDAMDLARPSLCDVKAPLSAAGR
ncbi:MAG TPA: hypothetical protein VK539_21960 [Myxococcaceae bacterium]|nr:hypothetical protein [Myxococcaceae bacterium]